LTSADSASIAVAATAVIYTRSFKLAFADFFCVSYKATGTAPDVLIELEQGVDRPTTEGSSDTAWVEPENMANIETNLTTTTWHHKNLSPVTLPYARFKITGNAGNHATDTVLTMKISRQEEL